MHIKGPMRKQNGGDKTRRYGSGVAEAGSWNLMPPFGEGEHCVKHDHVCAATTVRTLMRAPVTNIDILPHARSHPKRYRHQGLFTCLHIQYSTWHLQYLDVDPMQQTHSTYLGSMLA